MGGLLEQAVAAQARVWGGAGNLPFALARGFTENELFQELIDRFDPDTWARHVVRVGNMAETEPAWLSRQETSLRDQLVEYPGTAADDFIHKHRSAELVEPTELDPDEWRQLVTDYAPLHHGSSETSIDWATTGVPQWPLVDAAAFRDLPPHVQNPRTTLGPVLQLILTTEVRRWFRSSPLPSQKRASPRRPQPA
jgi:hypothetical protein